MKKNRITNAEISEFEKFIAANSKPSAEVDEFVHNILLEKYHYLFQYKKNNKRYGYCTKCKNDIPLDFGISKTYFPEQQRALEAKHNDNIECPYCHHIVTKRYGGFKQHCVFANVAELRVHESGALMVFLYEYRYDYRKGIFNEPYSVLWRIGVFDLNKWVTFKWFSDNSCYEYTGDKYAKFDFAVGKTVTHPFSFSQEKTDYIHIFNIDEYKNSNLKYSCLDDSIKDFSEMFRYLYLYCSYPEIVEKLMKSENKEAVYGFLRNQMSGVFDWRAKTIFQFFKLDKSYYKLMKNCNYYYINEYAKIKIFQLLFKNNITFNTEIVRTINYVESYTYRSCFKYLDILTQEMTLNKALKYLAKQGEPSVCCRNYIGNNSFENSIAEGFNLYADYVDFAKKFSIDLNTKDLIAPHNLQLAHQEQIELEAQLRQEKNIREAKERDNKNKSFEKKELPKLKQLSFSDGKFLIRPAESYQDLLIEGIALSHCVYTNYANRYLIERKTNIFFIRKCNAPDIPFYTLEYNNGVVIQCRTKANKGTTPEVKDFIDKWLDFIKSTNKKKKREVA